MIRMYDHLLLQGCYCDAHHSLTTLKCVVINFNIIVSFHNINRNGALTVGENFLARQGQSMSNLLLENLKKHLGNC
jgi:hypothetical protein